MDRKMECPICKKKALFVGVHDDEGNYHGLVGCEYENDPWSSLSYALHHEGWGDCPLCTDGAYSTMGGMLFDTAEDAISALSPPNEPLTQADLDSMDYDKVWIDYGDDGEWALVVSGRIYALAVLEGTGFEDILRDEVNGETMDRPSGDYTVYRRPPEGEDET
jgi:hypothetical protein